MNQDTELNMGQKNYINSENGQKSSYSFYRSGTLLGIVAGVGMAIFLVLAQLASSGDSIAVKFFKYLFLAGILAYGLYAQREYLQEEYNFKNGIMFGAFTTFVSAVTLSLMNILIFFTTDSLSFDKFLVDGNTFENVMLISGVLLFEVFVFGMIATFCVLQFIKPKRKGAEKPA